jgi:hypothetical protein
MVFAAELKKRPGTIGYIYIQKPRFRVRVMQWGNAIDLTKYLIEVHHIPWNRVAWKDLGFGNSFQTTLWAISCGPTTIIRTKISTRDGI